MPQWTIRRPEPADAQALATLHVAVWKHAYRGLIEQILLDRLDPARSLERWQQTICGVADGSLAHTVLIAVGDSGPLGIVEVGPAREEDAPQHIEVLSLNVAPRWHGTGVAGALIGQALGDSDAYLWVLRGNQRAVGFYRKLGFAPDGTQRYDDVWRCFDMRMQRPAVSS